jgi:hypothetical protein
MSSAKNLTINSSDTDGSPERVKSINSKELASPKGVDTLDISSASMDDFDVKAEDEAADELSQLFAQSGIVDANNTEATKTTQSAFDKKIRSGEDYLDFLGCHFTPQRAFNEDGTMSHTPLYGIPYSTKGEDGKFVTLKTEAVSNSYLLIIFIFISIKIIIL